MNISPGIKILIILILLIKQIYLYQIFLELYTISRYVLINLSFTQIPDLGINLGNYSCTDKERYEQLLNDFRNAEIPTNDVEYHEARWRKAVWNMPFNGMTVAMNTQTNHLLAVPQMRQVIRNQMLEVIHAAWACGIKTIGEDYADQMIQFTLDMVPYSPSMKLDFDFHRKMEIEYLYTRPIEIARQHGFTMARIEMLEAQLRFLEQ